MRFRAGAALLIALCSACTKGPSQQAAPTPATRHLLLITIDTLRADHVGAYGYATGPDASHRYARGARSTVRLRFRSAPITLTSHATIMTGRYPPGHGARHNGMRLDPDVPTIADALRQAGFATAAFVAAFPLDRRFGLTKGFQTYSDRMPRGPPGAARQRTCLATSSSTRRSRGSTSIVRAPSFSGSICSSRTHPMAIPRTIGRSASATTMKWRRRIVRWRDSSKRSGRNRRPP